jgi:hypothetical protein
MKKYIFFLSLSLFSFQSMLAQVDVAGGMGISFVYNPSLNDYIEYNWSLDDVQPFVSTVEFYGEIDYSLNEKYQLGIEYVYSLYDYSSFINNLNYKLDYIHHKPSFLAYYVIAGEGYKFKFGGGLGLRIVQLTESIGTTEEGAIAFSTTGFGLLGKIQGHTKLSDNFYANIGSTIRFDAPGKPENNGVKRSNPSSNEDVNINSFSVSINIGISYFF